MKPRNAALLASMIAGVIGGSMPTSSSIALAADQPKPAISEDASSALAHMGATLQAKEFSFQARTIRVYSDKDGELLHIFHSFKATVHRPDRLLVEVAGDDGPRRLVYDGKTLVLASGDGRKYASIPVPGTIEAMMKEAMGRLGVDFPLADFLTEAPDKAFLSGVTVGREVDTMTIDGIPCRHLFFSQPPDMELELWVEKNDQAVPRRLIITYRSDPGEPNFVAEMSDWNFAAHPSDAEFAFQPPQGAERVEVKPAAAAEPTGGKQ